MEINFFYSPPFLGEKKQRKFVSNSTTYSGVVLMIFQHQTRYGSISVSISATKAEDSSSDSVASIQITPR